MENNNNPNYNHPSDINGAHSNGNSPYLSPSDFSGGSHQYRSLRETYAKSIKKEKGIQVTGTIFSVMNIGIELFVISLFRRLIERQFLIRQLLPFFITFALLIPIIIVTLWQLRLIRGWNRKLDDTSQSLTRTQFELIDHIKSILFTTGVVLVFMVIFLHQFGQLPTPTVDLPVIVRFYQFLKRLSYLSVVLYGILEILQIIRWLRKYHALKKLESRMMAELTNLEDLDSLSQDFMTENDKKR